MQNGKLPDMFWLLQVHPVFDLRPSLLALSLSVAAAAVALAARADEAGDPLQFSIDALTHADNCLYMLQSSRDLNNADCQALREFHQEQFLDWSPDLDGLDASVRRRVVGNRQAYLQALEDIERERERLN